MSVGTGPGRVTPIRDLDLDVDRSQSVAISGVSGSGKTTLLNVIAGTIEPDSGEITVGGQSPRKARTLARVGVVHQDYRLVPFLTAIENVSMALEVRGAGRVDATERARAILNQVGLQDKTTSLPEQLSGGQQQRVALARALVVEPTVVVVDEPTAALDPALADDAISMLLATVRDSAASLIIASHDCKVVDRVHVRLDLVDGRLVREP